MDLHTYTPQGRKPYAFAVDRSILNVSRRKGLLLVA